MAGTLLPERSLRVEMASAIMTAKTGCLATFLGPPAAFFGAALGFLALAGAFFLPAEAGAGAAGAGTGGSSASTMVVDWVFGGR
jgi:hypothetical protein